MIVCIRICFPKRRTAFTALLFDKFFVNLRLFVGVSMAAIGIVE